MESSSKIISLSKSKSTYSSRMKGKQKEEEKKYEVFLKPKASVNVFSKRPATAVPTKAKVAASRPKTAVPKPKPKPKIVLCKYGYFVSRETIEKKLKTDKKFESNTNKSKLEVVSKVKKKPIRKVGKVEEKKTPIKEEDNKEEEMKVPLFSDQSEIAKENQGNVNPVAYLSNVFQRFNETGEDEMHLNDVLVYSNIIYQNSKANPSPTRLIGPVKKFVTGIIMDFIDYKFMMTRIRYLNRSFLVFTQENCHYSQRMDKKAYIKANLKEIYEGELAIPMLNHPYYTNCTKLTIIYQICRFKDSNCSKQEYNNIFMKDLFERSLLFPSIKTLKIIASHSRVESYDCSKLIDPYKFVAESPYLQELENLIIKDSRLSVNWKSLQLITPERFSKLKYFDVPINAIYDYKISEETPVRYFPGLHVKYSHCADNCKSYNCKLTDRFYNMSWNNNAYETSRMEAISCDKLEYSYLTSDSCYYFKNINNITMTNFMTYDPDEHLKALKKFHCKSMGLPDSFFEWQRSTNKIVRVQNEEIQAKQISERGIDEFKQYQFVTGFIDPIEEFVVPDSYFSDHCLYLLTNSPSFVNLKIIDFRGNPIKSLLLFKLNYFESQGTNLEELYVDTVVNEGNSYNISFFFETFYERFNNLNVLWIEAKSNNLFVENEELKITEEDQNLSDSSSEEVKSNSSNKKTKKRTLKYKFRKLFLGGINFIDRFGQDILNGLYNCEELTLKKCKFEVLDQSDPLCNLTSLKSLSIIETDTLFDSLYKCINLHKSLSTLKVNSVKSTEIMKVIEMFKNLNTLRIARIKFVENKIKFDASQLPLNLKKLELIKSEILGKSIFEIILNKFSKITNLTLLDNNYSQAKMMTIDSPEVGSKVITIMFDDSILNLLPPVRDDPWGNLAKTFPNVEIITYYKKAIKVKMPSIATKMKLISGLVDSINSKKMLVNTRKLIMIKKCASIESYYYGYVDIKTKTRGLFEYEYDSLTTIESILDN